MTILAGYRPDLFNRVQAASETLECLHLLGQVQAQGERKRPTQPSPDRTRRPHAFVFSGSSSSMRLFGQIGSLSRVSFSQGIGSIPFRQAVFSSDWQAQSSAAVT